MASEPTVLREIRSLAEELRPGLGLHVPNNRYTLLHDALDAVGAVLDSGTLRCGDCGERMAATAVETHVCGGRFSRMHCGDCGELVDGERVSEHVCGGGMSLRPNATSATARTSSTTCAASSSPGGDGAAPRMAVAARRIAPPFLLRDVYERLERLVLELSGGITLSGPLPWWELFTVQACEELAAAVARVRSLLDEQFVKCGDCEAVFCAADDLADHACFVESATHATPRPAAICQPCKRPRDPSPQGAIAPPPKPPSPPPAGRASVGRSSAREAPPAARQASDAPAAAEPPRTPASATEAARPGAAPSAGPSGLRPSFASDGSLLAPTPAPASAPRRKTWSAAEDQTICDLVSAHGLSFGLIATELGQAGMLGRTADAVRNRWGRLRSKGSLPDELRGNSYRCAACGEPKRGHVCTRIAPPVATATDDAAADDAIGAAPPAVAQAAGGEAKRAVGRGVGGSGAAARRAPAPLRSRRTPTSTAASAAAVAAASGWPGSSHATEPWVGRRFDPNTDLTLGRPSGPTGLGDFSESLSFSSELAMLLGAEGAAGGAVGRGLASGLAGAGCVGLDLVDLDMLLEDCEAPKDPG